MQQGARKQVASSAKTQPTCSETPSVLLCDRESACLPRQLPFKEQPEVQEICEVEVRTFKYSGSLTAEKVETGGDERTC